MTDSFIKVASITSTHGLKGYLKVRYSGDIFGLLDKKNTLYSTDKKPFNVLSLQHKAPGLSYVLFEGYTDINSAEKLIGQSIYVLKSDVYKTLKSDEFYEFQLLGFCVKHCAEVYSSYTLSEIIDTPAHPILSFKFQDKEVLVPFISNFIGEIDTESKTIEVLNWKDWLEV